MWQTGPSAQTHARAPSPRLPPSPRPPRCPDPTCETAWRDAGKFVSADGVPYSGNVPQWDMWLGRTAATIKILDMDLNATTAPGTEVRVCHDCDHQL